MRDRSIFVSVAAYREFDLLPTLRDCIGSALEPDELHICVCWQRDEEESLAELESDPRVVLLRVPFGESRGVPESRRAL